MLLSLLYFLKGCIDRIRIKQSVHQSEFNYVSFMFFGEKNQDAFLHRHMEYFEMGMVLKV